MLSTLLTCILAVVATSSALAPLEPPDGKFLFGAWLDSDIILNDTTVGNDSPYFMNQRTGLRFSSYQLAQTIPVGNLPYHPFGPAFADVGLLDETGTDAILFLTVYANDGLEAVSDFELERLASQLRNITVLMGRPAMLRFCPEMNGNWFVFGQRPTLFVQTWIRMYNIVKSRAPNVAIVWAPNLGPGYPYGGRTDLSPEDMAVMDTNRNGTLDRMDDPYTPYWPGDQYVDWVALSVYFKGIPAHWPWRQNELAPHSFAADLMTGGRYGGNIPFDFYQMFSASKGKPFCIAESNAAFHVRSQILGPLAPGVGHLAQAQSYWQGYLTDPDFYARFPLVKMINLFEFKKWEPEATDNIYRDFRITWDLPILTAFLTDLRNSGIVNRIQFAKPFNPTVSVVSTIINPTIIPFVPYHSAAPSTKTINNKDGYESITDAELEFLAEQVRVVTEEQGRDAFIRFLPEMNGNWYAYGYQPTRFKETWIRMATVMRSKAPKAALVWSPNMSVGYPFGVVPAGLSAEDLEALDTNGNGRVDYGDDPFTPYWPGDEYVDWTGLSLYFKGTKDGWPWKTNKLTPKGYVTEQITGGGEGGNAAFNFYKMFSTPETHDKPFMLSETGGAFHIASSVTGPIDPGPGHMAVVQSYWRSYLANATFWEEFPRLKHISLFEFKKPLHQADEEILRDYRVTFDPTCLEAFKADLQQSGIVNRIVQPAYKAFVAPVPTTTPKPTRRRNAASKVSWGVGGGWIVVGILGLLLVL
ncbi:hypothetical protein HDV05_005429 [Chytridiales sp. JEL 0842]|nr:hypothetical protein HDV05_005429 [Chytridiales sp. JEL 0842]